MRPGPATNHAVRYAGGKRVRPSFSYYILFFIIVVIVANLFSQQFQPASWLSRLFFVSQNEEKTKVKFLTASRVQRHQNKSITKWKKKRKEIELQRKIRNFSFIFCMGLRIASSPRMSTVSVWNMEIRRNGHTQPSIMIFFSFFFFCEFR